MVWPAPVASATWRSSSTIVQSAGLAPVVEDRLAHELDLDAAAEAPGRADEQVIGVVVGRRARVGRDRVLAAPGAHRQRVAHDDPARSVERQVVTSVLLPGSYGALDGVAEPERAEPEGAGPAVEQRRRTRWARRTAARTASRWRRRARSGRRCGSSERNA